MTQRIAFMLVIGLALLVSACAGDDAAAQETTSTQLASATSTTTVPPTTTTAPPTTTTVPSTTTTTTAAPDLEDGEWVVVADSDSTVTFVKPEGYTPIDLTAGDVEDIFDQIEEDGFVLDGELRTVIDQMIATQSLDFVYWAFDFASASIDFVPNVNIIKTPAGPFDRIEVYLELFPAQLEKIGLEVISIEEVETPGGPAAMIVSTSPEDWIEYATVQLVAPGNDWVYTFSFSFEDVESVDMDLVVRTFASVTSS